MCVSIEKNQKTMDDTSEMKVRMKLKKKNAHILSVMCYFSRLRSSTPPPPPDMQLTRAT